MNYKAGDTVVCIDSRGGRILNLIHAGQEYTVRSVNPICTTIVGLADFKSYPGRWECFRCKSPEPFHWHFRPYRFIKLDKTLLLEEEESKCLTPTT